MPALACSMKKGLQRHRQGKRREPLMANFTSKGLRRLIAPFRRYCALNYLKTQYRKRLRQHYHQTATLLAPTTLHGFTTQQGLTHPLTTTHLPYHRPSPPRHHTRICSRTCRHVTTQTLLATLRHQGHLKAGMVRISIQDLKFIVYRQCASVVSRCF